MFIKNKINKIKNKRVWNEQIDKISKRYLNQNIDKNKKRENNIILTNNVYKSLKEFRGGYNNNILLLGTSASGQSYCFDEPNIYQGIGTYVVWDSIGHYIKNYGQRLIDLGYNIECLNIDIDEDGSFYNPLDFVESGKDIHNLSRAITVSLYKKYPVLENHFIKYQEYLLAAAIFCVLEDDSLSKTLNDVYSVLKSENFRGDFLSLVDKDDSNHTGFDSYVFDEAFSLEYPKKELIDKLSFLENEKIKRMTSSSSFSFSSFRDSKTALFLISGVKDSDEKSIFSIFLYQLYDYIGNNSFDNGEYIRLFLDDFRDIRPIYNFEYFLNTQRNKGVSTSIITNSINRISEIYCKDYYNIISPFDNLLLFSPINNDETADFVLNKIKNKDIVINPDIGAWFKTGCDLSVADIRILPSNAAMLISEEAVVIDTKFLSHEHYVDDLEPFYYTEYFNKQ